MAGGSGEQDGAIAVALTGASGAAYGLRLIEVLAAQGCRVELMVSAAAQVVLAEECDLPVGELSAAEQLAPWLADKGPRIRMHALRDWHSPLASGSSGVSAMVICPCSMGTLAAVAHGLSDNLIERAADCMLKERRPLILVPRETPFSSIHLENMLKLSQSGAVVLPAAPGFYHRPASVAQLVDFIVGRILDHLGRRHDLSLRWGEPSQR
ncbi:MAG: UbiX family flavin prenyltransferase [Magnetococcales bacterium]|nr:UbiX family flavin prenyltransferase [Magnetococcales bacterium]